MKATLKPLPYGYNALSPMLKERTLRLHHDIHQMGYVKGWNRLWSKKKKTPDDWRNLSFHGAGIIVHELYWDNFTPRPNNTRPSTELEEAMTYFFGSPNEMAQQMIEMGTAIKGSGHIVLAWLPRFNVMTLLTIQNHELNWIPGAIPLLVIDVWEHAYYLQYENRRKEYLTAVWPYVNWNVVSQRFRHALGQ